MSALSVLAPMPIERAALARGLAGARVRTDASAPAERHRESGDAGSITLAGIGIGPASAARAARTLGITPGAVLLAGVAGALVPDLAPGDVVLANELRGPDGETIPCADPSLLASVLTAAGLSVRVGPIASAAGIVRGAGRASLAATGALAVDMESAWVARAVGSRPLTVLRVILDSPEREVLHPLHTATGMIRALATLRRVAAALGAWTELFSPREVVLAAPRASCAGVDRAVEIVERVLADHGAPVYVRKQIVHNAHVVADLQSRGAIFVEELDEVPAGSTAIFSAHGVSPAVRAQAAARELAVIDATCPLVAKVHSEARRFAAGGYEIVLVGHEGHEEIEGTYGEAPERTRIVASVAEVDALEVEDPARVAYLTQTTLALDETAEVVDALRDRFPEITGPGLGDICYATQNRQDAVRALAADCELVLVVGSANSSNSNRLVEVARRAGARAALVEDAAGISPALLAGARRIGLSAGASAPETLVQAVVAALSALGEVQISERRVAREDVHFKLPSQVRPPEVIPCPSR